MFISTVFLILDINIFNCNSSGVGVGGGGNCD